jgi:hypothetical protein
MTLGGFINPYTDLAMNDKAVTGQNRETGNDLRLEEK